MISNVKLVDVKTSADSGHTIVINGSSIANLLNKDVPSRNAQMVVARGQYALPDAL